MDGFECEEKDFFFAYNMILDLPISEHAKIVYMCLCRFSDSDKKSFPSHASIGKKCSIKSRTTVIDAIDKLMEVGLLDYKTRKTSKGGQTSNLYFLYNKPNIEVQKKYQKLRLLKERKKKEREKSKSCSVGGYPPVQQMDSPPVQQMDSSPVQQMDIPCSTDGQPPVQQMDTPCSTDGHEVYPSKYIHLKNTQSINQDGLTDSNELNSLFEKIGVEKIRHVGQIDFIKMVLQNMLQTRRIGKNTYTKAEILEKLENITCNVLDDVIDRYAAQAKKRNIPAPFEYIKTCIFSAGKDTAALTAVKPLAAATQAPTYDLDEYVNLSMKFLIPEENRGDQKCPT